MCLLGLSREASHFVDSDEHSEQNQCEQQKEVGSRSRHHVREQVSREGILIRTFT